MAEPQKINASDLLVNAKIIYFQSTNEFCVLLADPRKTNRQNDLKEDYYKKLCNINTIFSQELKKKNINNELHFQSFSYVIHNTSFVTFVDVSENLLFNNRLPIGTFDSLFLYLGTLIHEIKGEKDEACQSLINDKISRIFTNDLKGSYKKDCKEVFKSLSPTHAVANLTLAILPNSPWNSCAPKEYLFRLQSENLKPSQEFLQNFLLQKNNFGAYSIDPLCFFNEFFPEVCKAIDFSQYTTIENHQDIIKKSNGIYENESAELVQKNIEQQLLGNEIGKSIKGNLGYKEEFYDAYDGSLKQTNITESTTKNGTIKSTILENQTTEETPKPITSENQTAEGDQKTPKSIIFENPTTKENAKPEQKENIKQHCFLIQWIIDFFKKIAEYFKHDKKNFEHQDSNRVAENTIEV